MYERNLTAQKGPKQERGCYVCHISHMHVNDRSSSKNNLATVPL